MLIRLAIGPSYLVTYWQAHEMNGWTYYTKPKDKKGSSQNNGVRTKSLDLSGNMQTYYGFIEEIMELDYGQNLQIPVFKCKWAQLKAVDVEKYGFAPIDLSVAGFKDDLWILANNV